MKNLHLFTGYKKNSELCVPFSTASKRRCKHRPCGSFFVLFLIFVLFLVSSCGGESPSPAPKAAGDNPPTTKPADPYVPNKYYDSVKFDFSKLDNSADITRITLAYTLNKGTYDTPFADTASSDFSTSDSNYILHDLTPNTTYYYRLTVTRGDATKDVSGDFTTTTNVDDGDGLIDIYNVAQLHNMRYNLEGTSYKTDNSDASNASGCPNEGCSGYELKNNLTFDRAGSKSGTWSTSDSVNGTIYTLDASDNAATYFVVDPNDGTGGWRPIGSAMDTVSNVSCSGDCFNTIFEGNGYTITGLAISRSNIDDIGMFGAIGANADIRRVGLVANLASYTGSVTDIAVGGLVGVQVGGSITASYATGDANGRDGSSNAIGGLVGRQAGGIIIASYATGAANGGAGSSSLVGGLVGWQSRGSITASYATGPANGGDVSGHNVGGLVGYQSGGSITASYATGTVNGGGRNTRVGGLVGQQNRGSITASYATGPVVGGAGTNNTVGGLVGFQEIGSITASYATGEVTRGATIEKLLGHQENGKFTASYGFGTGGTNTNSNPLPTGVTAKDLTADNNPAWDSLSFNTEGAWDFGTTSQAPALKYADYDGALSTDYACVGASDATVATTIYIPYCGNFLPGQKRRPVPDGTSPTPTAGASALLGSFALVDQDHDGYIDINNLGALRNIIHNPEGTSYKTSGASQGRTNGCPSNLCQGYELIRNFHAAEVVSGGGLDHLLRNILTQDAVIKSNGYSIADLYLED